jgi:hypothetical protein
MQCGPFVDYEFVIYTNQKMESNSPLQGGDSDPLITLSSGKEYGKYIAFDETSDKDIFEFFEELSKYHNYVSELNNLLKSRASLDEKINQTIQKLQKSNAYKKILKNLDSLMSTGNKDNKTNMIKELAKYDFTLFKEFLCKVKIFQNQSNQESIKGLIEQNLQDACRASKSVAKVIYTKFKEGFNKWWEARGNVVWLNKNSRLWQEVQRYIITEIKELSKHEIKDIEECGEPFSELNVRNLSDAIKQNTVLNIVTKPNFRTLQKVETYQALNTLGFHNYLFIDIRALIFPQKDINKFWPCKWSEVLVVDCGADGGMAPIVLERLQESAGYGEELHNADDNTAGTLFNVLQKYKQKLILISPRIKASLLPKELQNNFEYFEDNCDISDQNS